MRLRQLRLEKKLKQTEVAEMLSCSQGVYSRYESGEREPPFDIITRLADIYGVTVDYLLGREKPLISAQEKAPRAIDEQIMKELEGMDAEQCREVLNFIRFRKQGGQ